MGKSIEEIMKIKLNAETEKKKQNPENKKNRDNEVKHRKENRTIEPE